MADTHHDGIIVVIGYSLKYEGVFIIEYQTQLRIIRILGNTNETWTSRLAWPIRIHS